MRVYTVWFNMLFGDSRDRWDGALAAGRVVKPSTLAQMWTPVRLNYGGTFPYGLGWFVDERLRSAEVAFLQAARTRVRVVVTTPARS